jgi:hypothetical protein
MGVPGTVSNGERTMQTAYVRSEAAAACAANLGLRAIYEGVADLVQTGA